MTALLSELLALEDRLVQGEFEALLHPDFLEFGLSGRRWTRAEVVAALTPNGNASQRSEIALQVLASDMTLLTWLSRRPGRPTAWRSSLWQRSDGAGWQLRFHQATPTGSP